MHKHLLLLFGAGCIISCQKEASNPANNFPWFGTQNTSVYNYVLINANQVITNADSDELHIGVSAAFIDSNNHQVTSVRALAVNDQLITPSRDSTYSYNYASTDLNKGSQFFGNQVRVTIHGMDEEDTVSSSIYVPKQLTGTVNSFAQTISLNNGLTLSWAPDPNNSWGNVIVQLFYYDALSRKNDPTLPANISTVSITTQDNGKYVLTGSDLKSFPANAFIGITIARGTQCQAILPLSHKRIFYFSSASVSTQPIRVVL